MKKIIKIIDWEVYPFDVLFTYGTTEKEVMRHIEQKLKYILDDEEREHMKFDSKQGKTIMLKGGQTVIWIKNPKNYANIAHEAFHAVSFLFNKIGIRNSDDSDEAWAYAIAFLVDKIIKIR